MYLPHLLNACYLSEIINHVAETVFISWYKATLPQQEKAANFFWHTEKLFSSDNHQSMKTSDSDLEVNRNVHPDEVNVIECV